MGLERCWETDNKENEGDGEKGEREERELKRTEERGVETEAYMHIEKREEGGRKKRETEE